MMAEKSGHNPSGNSNPVSGTVLLFGGTSETVPLARALVLRGYSVLVSMATDVKLHDALPQGVARRNGRLTKDGMIALMKEYRIVKVVDATHPFAVEASRTIRAACEAAGLTCERYQREATDLSTLPADAVLVSSHEEAAVEAVRIAKELGKPILLTTGSRNLVCYMKEARKAGIPILARVLPHPESLAACESAGLAPHEIVARKRPLYRGRHGGPFEKSSNRGPGHERQRQGRRRGREDGGRQTEPLPGRGHPDGILRLIGSKKAEAERFGSLVSRWGLMPRRYLVPLTSVSVRITLSRITSRSG